MVGNGLKDVSENELEIWYGAEDEFDIELFTPGGQRIGPISPGKRVENLLLPDRTVVSIYNQLSNPKNGDNRICRLSQSLIWPILSSASPPAPGGCV